MNTPPKKPTPTAEPGPAKGADDGTIPVLTERLGLPPLDFDTTLPLIESTLQSPRGLFEGLTALPNPPKLAVPPVAPAVPAHQAAVARETIAPREPVNVLGATSGAPTASAAAAPVASPAPAVRAATDSRQWGRIEIELRTAILREIAEQLPREVEAIVRSRMSAAIDRLMSGLAAETRVAIAASLREIIERAVHAELERLRNSNRG